MFLLTRNVVICIRLLAAVLAVSFIVAFGQYISKATQSNHFHAVAVAAVATAVSVAAAAAAAAVTLVNHKVITQFI